MITPRELEQLVAQIAPPDLAEEWDNVGLLLDSGEPTDRILFALDATAQAVEEAKKLGCGIIVTHHPLIFHPLRRIEAGSPVQRAAKAGISVISAHTNFDAAAGGVNDLLAEKFALADVCVGADLGRAGTLPQGEMPLCEFAALVKRTLGLFAVSAVDGGVPVHRVLVIGGGGGSYIGRVKEAGCDTLLTGEAAHHELLQAKADGINMVVAGHFATEDPTMQGMCSALQSLVGERAECILSKENRDPAMYL